MTNCFRIAHDMWQRLRHPIEAVRRAALDPTPAVNLAVLRVLVYGYCVRTWWGRSYSWDAARSKYEAVGLYKVFPLASDQTLAIMQQLGQWAALMCVFGLAFRPASIVCALTFPYLLGSDSSFGKVNHSFNLLAVALFIFAFSRAADFGSLDWWFRQRKDSKPVTPSGEYRWPIYAVWMSCIGMYWSAGVSKLVHTGWGWALSDNFQLLLLRHHVTHSPPTQLGITLAQYPAVSQAMALFALLTELLCPLALLGGGWALLMGAMLCGLQVGIYVLLGVLFKPMAPVFAAFVPWRSLFEPAWRRFKSRKNKSQS
jgi:hypothetical protein